MIDLVKQIETNKLVSYRGLRKIFDENLKNSSFFWGGGNMSQISNGDNFKK